MEKRRSKSPDGIEDIAHRVIERTMEGMVPPEGGDVASIAFGQKLAVKAMRNTIGGILEVMDRDDAKDVTAREALLILYEELENFPIIGENADDKNGDGTKRSAKTMLDMWRSLRGVRT